MIRSAQLLAVLVVLSIGVSACARRPVTVETYERGGLRFSHFSNWRIDQDKANQGAAGARILQLQGPGHALVRIIVVPALSAVTAESFAASVSQGRTSAPATARFAGREVRGVRQTFDLVLLGQHLPHEATFYMLQTDTHKLVIMSQVARESLEATRPALQKVYDTLSLDGQIAPTAPAASGS